MMYNEKLALAIKVNNKILRESSESVQIPFGSEFSILIKNLHSRKAQVTVTIDGDDVLDGHAVIVESNSSLDLERYIQDSDMDVGRKFKFIEKVKEISDHRGDKIDDGLVHIEYRFEQVLQIRPSYDPLWPHNQVYGGNITRGILGSSSTEEVLRSTDTVSVSSQTGSDFSEAGITVKGSESDQSFKTGYIGILESHSHSMVLQLKGLDPKGEEVKKPLLVKTKKTCPSCGSMYSSKYEYCAKDGTFLETK